MRIITLLCFILPIWAGATPIYKWVDSDGFTHYTQDPPTQGNGKPFIPQVSPGVGQERAREIINELRQTFATDAANHAKLQADRDQAQAQIKEQEARSRRCEEARTRLENLHGSRQVALKDDMGEYRRIDDDERASLVKQTEALIQKECP